MISSEIGIIGAGPIGIELAVALKRGSISYLHFDGGQIGHTISWFAPQTRFFSSNERIAIAGVPLQTLDQSKATREEYLAYLRGIVQQFDLEVRTYQPVKAIERIDDGFLLATDKAGEPLTCKVNRLVLATGGTARPRMLNVPGEDLPHVSHYFEDPHRYFRKRVLIVGGKNSAVEAALRCHHIGAEVTCSYRSAEFNPRSIKYWLLPEINGLISSGKIEGHFHSCVTAIDRSHVTLLRTDREESMKIPADFVLLLVGYVADMSLCKMAGVTLEGEQEVPVYNEQTMETNVPGLYVAGTVVGGTQVRYRVFIENCHIHVERIVAALTGQAPPPPPVQLERPES